MAQIGKTDQLATLNGLRGVAALCVLLFHRAEWMGAGFPFPDAYLAVDFFFLLSGFVVSRAYSGKLAGGMGFADFMGRRLERLYPLVLLGVALGAGIALVKAHGHVGGGFVLDAAASLAALPTPWHALGWQLDPPLWSLFFEIVINVVFGLLAIRLRGWPLTVAVAILGSLFLIFSGHIYGGRPDATARLGWETLHVAFLFFLGVALEGWHAAGRLPTIRIGVLVGSGLLLASFMARLTPFPEALRLAAVCLLYPLILIGGANCQPTGVARKGCDLLGDLSYPLYILHIPLLAILSAVAMGLHLPKEPASALAVVARFVGVAALAYATLRIYDAPVRAWLGSVRRSGLPRISPAPAQSKLVG